ncbi:MAG: hypothetical protein LBJ87_12090, partial [bacterium]|nr:hypothetical protein [bacterium]
PTPASTTNASAGNTATNPGKASDQSTATNTGTATGTPFTAGPAAPVLPFLLPLLLGALAIAVGAVLLARRRRL